MEDLHAASATLSRGSCVVDGHRRQRLQGLENAIVHPVQQAVASRIIGPVQRLLESKGIGGAMALEHQAAQAEQRGAVVAAMIDPRLEVLEHRQSHQRGQPGIQRARELLLDEARQHRCKAFGRLERDVADEPVAHDDVGRALEDVVAFDIAVEVELPLARGFAQQLAGLLDRLAALDRLFADVQQADARIFPAFDCGDQRAAHHRELQQMLGAAVDIRAQVEHGRVAVAFVRHHRRDRGAVDPFERAQQVTRHRHQRAGVAGRARKPAPPARARRQPRVG